MPQQTFSTKLASKLSQIRSQRKSKPVNQESVMKVIHSFIKPPQQPPQAPKPQQVKAPKLVPKSEQSDFSTKFMKRVELRSGARKNSDSINSSYNKQQAKLKLHQDFEDFSISSHRSTRRISMDRPEQQVLSSTIGHLPVQRTIKLGLKL